jgi:hypothetical protein
MTSSRVVAFFADLSVGVSMIPLANVPVFDLVLGDDHPNTPRPQDKLGSWNSLAMRYRSKR